MEKKAEQFKGIVKKKYWLKLLLSCVIHINDNW